MKIKSDRIYLTGEILVFVSVLQLKHVLSRRANQVYCEKSKQIEMKTIGCGADVPQTLRKQNPLANSSQDLLLLHYRRLCKILSDMHTPGNFHRRRILTTTRRVTCAFTRKKASQLHAPPSKCAPRIIQKKSLSAAREYVSSASIYIFLKPQV